MKKPDNNTWLLILMIISQIMLTGLVIQWLRSQWQDEKEAFSKSLNQEFRESVNQVMDSMLLKHVIVPVLKDTIEVHDQLITFEKKLSGGNTNSDQHISSIIRGKGNFNNAVVTISMDDSVRRSGNNRIYISTSNNSQKNMLLRSVKLIIRQTSDSAGSGRKLSHMMSADPDTTLLKIIFEEKINNKGIKSDIIWVYGSPGDKNNTDSSGFFFDSLLLEKPFGAEIKHYNRILLQGISAQIVFAFVLLLFTGAAFFFTYRSLKKMETLNTLRNDFISNISHELKTPVSTVSVALEALKNYNSTKDATKFAEYLEISGKEMKRLDLLISQVLNTSRLEDHNQFIMKEEGDLVSLSRDVINSMQVRFLQQRAKVRLISEKEVCILDLDKLHIQGVLINLLDNSLKYAITEPEIEVIIEQEPAKVILKIRDNGPGIPKEYLSKVFDKFFRVPTGNMHNVKGYGLGLSFADLVMKQHSGSIRVRNLTEKGCEFVLVFPKSQK